MRPYRTLEDTFGGRAGWTVEHSHSGLQRVPPSPACSSAAPRGRALRLDDRPNLVTARNILDAVRDGRIDVGPLDAYWHLLIARHQPALTAGIRVLASTEVGDDAGLRRRRLDTACNHRRTASRFYAGCAESWFARLADELLIDGFAPSTRRTTNARCSGTARRRPRVIRIPLAEARYPYPA